MAFLTIDGFTIPIKRGGQIERHIIGDRSRAFDGSLLVDRRIVKRRWRFETTVQDEMTAKAIEQLIEGAGQLWLFGDDNFSTKGVDVVTGTGILVPNAASDGDFVIPDSHETVASTRAYGSVRVESASQT